MISSKFILRKFLLLICLCFSISVFANEDSTAVSSAKFNPGKLIMGHIMDQHEWHLWGKDEHAVVIPLPIILYNKEHGFNCFLSNRFEEEHGSYSGYKMNEEGHITSKDGSVFYDISITKNVLSLFISAAILLFVFLSVAKAYTRNKDKAPKGLQGAMELIIVFVRDDIAKAAR